MSARPLCGRTAGDARPSTTTSTSRAQRRRPSVPQRAGVDRDVLVDRSRRQWQVELDRRGRDREFGPAQPSVVQVEHVSLVLPDRRVGRLVGDRARLGREAAARRSTGTTYSRLSTTKASCLPSGENTGPSSPRVASDRNGIGATYSSAVDATSTYSSWLVPSRKRFENGFTAASTIVSPSADQLTRPGWNSVGVSCRTSPRGEVEDPGDAVLVLVRDPLAVGGETRCGLGTGRGLTAWCPAPVARSCSHRSAVPSRSLA